MARCHGRESAYGLDRLLLRAKETAGQQDSARRYGLLWGNPDYGYKGRAECAMALMGSPAQSKSYSSKAR